MSTRIPASLREVIERDHAPVRPLPPPWRRALTIVLVALVLLAGVILTHRLRPDLSMLSFWIGWGAAALELVVGTVLVGLALRESVPGQMLPVPVVILAVGLGLASDILVAVATWVGTDQPAMGFLGGSMCLRHELVLSAPAVLLTVFLVLRALPLRPCITGLLAGAGTGLMADAINHLLCPVSDLRHVLVWHTGAIVILMALGWVIGRLWEIARSRKG